MKKILKSFQILEGSGRGEKVNVLSLFTKIYLTKLLITLREKIKSVLKSRKTKNKRTSKKS